ncbi:MAG: hypothetical protein AAGF01_23760 [Cyanobacteria bacterium P01_G01_bin.38]
MRLTVLLQSVLVLAFGSAVAPCALAADMLFDRGLPAENLNIEPDPERSNIRWRGDFENGSFYGDDFIIGSLGERYVINHIRTWAVLGYSDYGPSHPEQVGDWFSQVRLLGGVPSDAQLPLLTSGTLTSGSSTTSNSDIVITQVSYPDAEGSNYFNFGPTIPIWQIDFYNLDWVIEGGTRYNFSVQGTGRSFSEDYPHHAWFNHASNAAISGTPQQATDDLMLVFSDIGGFLYVASGEDDWNKPTDLNIQIFGDAIEGGEPVLTIPPDTALVEVVHQLNDAGFLTGRAYRRALLEVEHGGIELRSQLLDQLWRQSVPESDEATVHCAYAFLISEEELEELSEAEIDALMAAQQDAQLEALRELEEEGCAVPELATQIEMQKILDNLNVTGVLSEQLYVQLQDFVNSRTLFEASELYSRAADEMRFEEALAPELVKPELAKWREVGILSDESHASLVQALENSEFKHPVEFLRHIEAGLLLDMETVSPEPEVYYAEAYQAIAEMLVQSGALSVEPGSVELEFVVSEDYVLSVEQFETYYAEEYFAEHPDAEFNELDISQIPKTYDAIFSASVDGQTYQQSSYHGTLDSGLGIFSRVELHGLIRLFNKILHNQGSPYYLYTAERFHNTYDYDRNRYQLGLIVLTQEQADVYFGGNFYPEYELPLTRDRIETIMTIFKEIGLLDHLSESDFAEAKIRITRGYITEPYQLLAALGDVAFLQYGGVVAEREAPYASFIQQMAEIAQGQFQPTNIEESFDWVQETGSVAFMLNGNRYSIDLETNDGWLDPQFFEFIEQVAATEVPQGQFYPVSDEYDSEGYIFLTTAQVEALRSQNLITLPDEDN